MEAKHWGLKKCIFFFFNDTATTEIYTLSLHDALPISTLGTQSWQDEQIGPRSGYYEDTIAPDRIDRKSTRLNSSHGYISYAVFCLKKKKKKISANNFVHIAVIFRITSIAP